MTKSTPAGTVFPWEASDGTRWLHIASTTEPSGWTGWFPGEDGVWFLADAEFAKYYPECPYILTPKENQMPVRTDLDRMLSALAEAERQKRITIHGDGNDRQKLAEDLLVGVGLNTE